MHEVEGGGLMLLLGVLGIVGLLVVSRFSGTRWCDHVQRAVVAVRRWWRRCWWCYTTALAPP